METLMLLGLITPFLLMAIFQGWATWSTRNDPPEYDQFR